MTRVPVLFFLLVAPILAQLPQEEIDILVQLFQHLGTPIPESLLQDACTFHPIGVTCNSENTSVTGISWTIAQYHLYLDTYGDIGKKWEGVELEKTRNLSQREYIEKTKRNVNLYHRQFVETELTNIREIYEIQGNRPSFSHNSGNIKIRKEPIQFPIDVLNLSELSLIHLSGFNIGDVPVEICSFPLISYLDLSNNSITEVPDCIWESDSLLILNFSENCLAGSLPWNMISKSKNTISVAFNNLEVVFPLDIQDWRSLEILDIGNTRVTGAVPDGLFDLPLVILNLNSTDLASNRFFKEMTRLTRLEVLNVGNNPQLIGTIPENIGKLTQLKLLVMENTGLKGSIPKSLETLHDIRILSLSGNPIAGQVPNLSKMTLLSTFSCAKCHNNVMGEIPQSLCGRGKVLVLDGNRLKGDLTCIGSPHLEYLFLSRNRLAGTIPASIYASTNLKALFLNENRLEGTISPEVGQWKEMSHLFIQSNRFSGPVPDEINNLEKLAFLDLSYNKFSKIPIEMNQNASFRYLRLSGLCLAECPDIQYSNDIEFCDISLSSFGSTNCILPDNCIKEGESECDGDKRVYVIKEDVIVSSSGGIALHPKDILELHSKDKDTSEEPFIQRDPNTCKLVAYSLNDKSSWDCGCMVLDGTLNYIVKNESHLSSYNEVLLLDGCSSGEFSDINIKLDILSSGCTANEKLSQGEFSMSLTFDYGTCSKVWIVGVIVPVVVGIGIVLAVVFFVPPVKQKVFPTSVRK